MRKAIRHASDVAAGWVIFAGLLRQLQTRIVFCESCKSQCERAFRRRRVIRTAMAGRSYVHRAKGPGMSGGHGQIENTEVFKIMVEALGLGRAK